MKPLWIKVAFLVMKRRAHSCACLVPEMCYPTSEGRVLRNSFTLGVGDGHILPGASGASSPFARRSPGLRILALTACGGTLILGGQGPVSRLGAEAVEGASRLVLGIYLEGCAECSFPVSPLTGPAIRAFGVGVLQSLHLFWSILLGACYARLETRTKEPGPSASLRVYTPRGAMKVSSLSAGNPRDTFSGRHQPLGKAPMLSRWFGTRKMMSCSWPG